MTTVRNKKPKRTMSRIWKLGRQPILQTAPRRYTRTTQGATGVVSVGYGLTSSFRHWKPICNPMPMPSCSCWKLTKHGTQHVTPKLHALHTLLTETFPNRKVLVFSQFADTVSLFGSSTQDLGHKSYGRRYRKFSRPNGIRLALQPCEQPKANHHDDPTGNYVYWWPPMC